MPPLRCASPRWHEAGRGPAPDDGRCGRQHARTGPAGLRVCVHRRGRARAEPAHPDRGATAEYGWVPQHYQCRPGDRKLDGIYRGAQRRGVLAQPGLYLRSVDRRDQAGPGRARAAARGGRLGRPEHRAAAPLVGSGGRRTGRSPAEARGGVPQPADQQRPAGARHVRERHRSRRFGRGGGDHADGHPVRAAPGKPTGPAHREWPSKALRHRDRGRARTGSDLLGSRPGRGHLIAPATHGGEPAVLARWGPRRPRPGRRHAGRVRRVRPRADVGFSAQRGRRQRRCGAGTVRRLEPRGHVGTRAG